MDTARITIHGIPAEQTPSWRFFVDHWLSEALLHGGGLMAMEDVHAAIAARAMQLWVIADGKTPVAAVVTAINVHPQAKVLTVVLTGGDGMAIWLPDLVDLLQRYGQAHGCAAVEAHGRPGWTRALQHLGWRQTSVTVAMEIEHG